MSNFKSPPIHRTPLYRAKSAYCSMKVRCGNANGKHPTYSNVELRMTLEEWLRWSIPEYSKFIEANPDISPSVSRFGDKGHYEIGNIEIISHHKNRLMQVHKNQNLIRPDGTKLCGWCRKVKPSSAFCKNRSKTDGFAHWCKSCMSQLNKDWKKRKRTVLSSSS